MALVTALRQKCEQFLAELWSCCDRACAPQGGLAGDDHYLYSVECWLAQMPARARQCYYLKRFPVAAFFTQERLLQWVASAQDARLIEQKADRWQS